MQDLLKNKILEHLELITDSFSELFEINSPNFGNALQLLSSCKGTIYFTGIGKNGHVAQKAASTYASLGFNSIFLNPVDAVHGDMGVIRNQDVVFAISKSGLTSELLVFLKNLYHSKPNVVIIFLSSNKNLANELDMDEILHLYCPTKHEAEPNNIVPTVSISNYVILLQSMALAMIDDNYMISFRLNHPGGTIGEFLKKN